MILKLRLVIVLALPLLVLALVSPTETPGGGGTPTATVVRPKESSEVATSFVASGTSTVVGRVYGRLHAPLKKPLYGITLREPKDANGRWLIYFKNVPRDTYDLVVSDALAVTRKDLKRITKVKVINFSELQHSLFGAAKNKGKGVDIFGGGVSVSTGCLSSFAPYGYLTDPDTALTDVKMQWAGPPPPPIPAPTSADFTFVDPATGFWSAQFPDLTNAKLPMSGEGVWNLTLFLNNTGQQSPVPITLSIADCGK